MVNPGIDQEIERWGRKEPRKQQQTETEQTCLLATASMGWNPKLWVGPGSSTSQGEVAQDLEVKWKTI